MTCIDGNNHRQCIICGDEWCRECCECRQTYSRLAGGKRNTACGCDTDAQARETAGSRSDGDSIDGGNVEVSALQGVRDQWHQRFRVATLHRQRFLYAHLRMSGVEHSDRTGFKRSIDGKDAHSEPRCHHPRKRLIQQSPTVRLYLKCRAYCHALPSGRPGHIGRTSTTSGTKWRSRFWMPCLRVAVEEGQPEQAPFMLR